MRALAIGGIAAAVFAYNAYRTGSFDAYAPESRSVVQQTAKQQPVVVEKDDPDMAAARAKARAGLDDFLKLAANPKPGTTNYSVKLPIYNNGKSEVFWITPFTVEGNVIRGKINNAPQFVSNVKLGQTVKFQKANIVDWMYVDENSKRIVGNFSLCAMLKKAPPADQEKLTKQFGLVCQI